MNTQPCSSSRRRSAPAATTLTAGASGFLLKRARPEQLIARGLSNAEIAATLAVVKRILAELDESRR
jgi:DNA-binding NarL/FixJ family response regulator